MHLKDSGTKLGFVCVSNELDFQEVSILRCLVALGLVVKVKRQVLVFFSLLLDSGV